MSELRSSTKPTDKPRYLDKLPSATRSSLKTTSKIAQQLHSPRRNHLLAPLSANNYLRLLPHMELISMNAGDILQEAGVVIEWVYFPTTSVTCLSYVTENGSSPAVGIAGNEGLIGIACVMGSDSSPTQAVVQSSGMGYRIRARALKTELQKNDELMRTILLYVQAFITQVSQTAVCNRCHSLNNNLCRWLLLSIDRQDSDELYLTHEWLATMLGVRREGVTQAAGKLQASGHIECSRGKIRVLDREALEADVCECYAVVNNEYKRLLLRKYDAPLAHPRAITIANYSNQAQG
jgi:CRP-like cAMP-binding protein